MSNTTFYISQVIIENYYSSLDGQLMRVFVDEKTEGSNHTEQFVFEFKVTQTNIQHDQIRVDFITHGKTANTIPKFKYCAYVPSCYVATTHYKTIEEEFKYQLLDYLAIKFGSQLEKQIDILSDM